MTKHEFLMCLHSLQTMALLGDFPGVGCIEISVSFVPTVGQTCAVFVHPRGKYEHTDVLYVAANHDDDLLEKYASIRQYIDELNKKAAL